MPDAGAGPDASTDATSGGPPVTNGQFADLVLGQSDLSSDAPNAGGESASSLALPTDVSSDGAHLWIADGLNARVLQFDGLPIMNKASATLVLGQPTMTVSTAGTTRTLLGGGYNHVFSDGTRIVIADEANNRVLIWSSIPTMTNAAPADIVVGQGSFTTMGTGNSATAISLPEGVWTDGTRLVVADPGNHRVLVWHSLPATGGAADTVLGQVDFGISTPPSAPTAGTIKFPEGVFFDGTRLFVADRDYHRVLVWVGLPSAGNNGRPADYVIGQSSLTASATNAGAAGPNASGLSGPTAALVAFGSLFVADANNHRVVVYTPVPTASGEAASAVLGQDDLTSGMVMSPAGNRMDDPIGLAVFGSKLFVADDAWNRVLEFSLHP